MSNELSTDEIEIIQEFIQESHDMIEELEPTIIELGMSCQGGNQPDKDTINAIFRLFHSMKGSAGFLEFLNISSVAHAAENLLDLIRSDKIKMRPEHVDLLCQSCDFAQEALDHVGEHFNDQGMLAKAGEMKNNIKDAIDLAQGSAAPAVPPEPAVAPEPAAEDEPGDGGAFEMKITPEMVQAFVQEAEELLQNAEQGLLKWASGDFDQEAIGSLFRDIHSFKGNCGFFNFADLERLSHQMENILDLVKSGKPVDSSAAEYLLNLIDVLKEGVADIGQGGDGLLADLNQYLQVLKGLLESEAVPVGPAGAKGSQAVMAAVPDDLPESTPEAVVPEQQSAAPTMTGAEKMTGVAAGKKPAAKTKATPALKRQDIRVDLDKLDNLINLIGELVIAENMVIRNPDLEGLELESFNKASQHMSKLVRELQEVAMIIRMIPVSGLFRRMIRLVHDLSSKAGKKVDLKLVGEGTEVDKTVVEMITDPLVHLLRNSLDHGVEPPAERLQVGKPEKGTVILSARHEEGQVWITVTDDGRGLNREKLLKKAVANGLVDGDGSQMSDKEVYNLIFHPGFSTAEKITDISGRGVGMDVVKQNLDKIKGRVDVESRPGQGTTLNLCIPLTLAIIDGMLIRVGTTRCILPILAIRESFCPTEEMITVTPDGGELVRVRENFFPVVRLHEVLGKEADHTDLDQGVLIILEHHDKGICLLVDEILGQQQTVIKGLSDYIGNVSLVSGCTILGNGEVCLILDVGSLIEIKHGNS